MQTNLSSNLNTIYLHGDHLDKTKAITCSLFAPPSPPHPPPGSLWVTQTDDITNSRYIQPVRSQQSWWCLHYSPCLFLSSLILTLPCFAASLSLPHTHTHTHTVFLSRPHSSAPLQTWSMLSLAHGSSRRAINLMITWKSWVSVPCMSISFFFCFFNECTLRRGVCAHACETAGDAAVVPVLQASTCRDGFEAS